MNRVSIQDPSTKIAPPSVQIAPAPQLERTREALPKRRGELDRAHRTRIGQVDNAANPQSPVDAALGVHFKKVLGGETLTGHAANAKHLRKMEEAANEIGIIERLPGRLGAVATLKTGKAFALYEYLFPNPDEREPTSDIKARLKTYDSGTKEDGGGFHALAIADKQGDVIGYTQGSTVPSDKGLFFYWQYGGVADREFMKKTYGKDSNPREHGILNTIHGANAATLVAAAKQTNQPALGMVWESEPRGLGDDAASIKFTGTRLDVHNRAGGRVMMGMTAEGELVNIHYQPRLTEDSEPIALHMMYRGLSYEEGDEKKKGELPKADGESIMMAWIENFRREGFAEKDVAEAEAEIRARLARSTKIVLLPADQVPDAITLAKTDPIMEKQILDMYGVDNLAAARKFYEAAIQSPSSVASS